MADQLDPRIVIDMIGGNCPVQAEGTIDGQEFYFRARHEHWSLSIGRDHDGAALWFTTGARDNAGWLDEDEAIALIAEAAKLYLARPLTTGD
jgi:hypothetical protein